MSASVLALLVVIATVHSAPLADRLAGQAVLDLAVHGERGRAENQILFHRQFFPRDPTYYNTHVRNNPYKDGHYGPCVHPIYSWPEKPKYQQDILTDPRNSDLRGLPIKDSGGFSEAVDALANQVTFVLKTCGPDAFRAPEDVSGDGELSDLPTIALQPHPYQQCPCSVPTQMNLQRAQDYDDRRAEEAANPSFKDMLAEDGPRIRAHLRRLIQFLRDTIRTSAHNRESHCSY